MTDTVVHREDPNIADLISIGTADRPSWRIAAAVLIYSRNGERINHPHGAADHAYATVHNVSTHKGGLRLDAGEPATKEACATLARDLGANAALCGFLPPEMLYLGARSIAWWRPPQRTRVFFDTTAHTPKNGPTIGKVTAVVPHPGLVFAVTRGGWYVYALSGADRPSPSTRLHRAPYFNTNEAGAICTGNVRLPKSLSPRALHDYERAFFDSNFTHPNVQGRAQLVKRRGGAYAFWRDLIDRGPALKAFPVRDLVALPLTLEGLARKFDNPEGKP